MDSCFGIVRSQHCEAEVVAATLTPVGLNVTLLFLNRLDYAQKYVRFLTYATFSESKHFTCSLGS